MKQLFKSFMMAIALILVLTIQIISAQTKLDIFNASTDITWLGLDFSHAKFFGTATQFGGAGEITNSQLKEKYIPEWNQIFISEMKKYDVASAVHRTVVKYSLDATEKANSNLKRDFFTNNSDELNTLDEKKIEESVKKYHFEKSEGIGLLFFVEEMNKGKSVTSAWVTFVNMKTKSVLLTMKETGRVGGIGFKNYWAKGFYNILKSVKSDFNDWNK